MEVMKMRLDQHLLDEISMNKNTTLHNFFHCLLSWFCASCKTLKMGIHGGNNLISLMQFPWVSKCSKEGRTSQSIASDLDGTLLKSSSSFPYFMLMAFEAGSPLRSFLLLLLSPFIALFYYFLSEAVGVRLMTFITFAGLRMEDVKTVARAVLPKFYMEDLNPATYHLFISFGKKYVVTANPRVMVESFLKEYLDVDGILATELHVFKGFCTGLLQGPVIVGDAKRKILEQTSPLSTPDVGLGDRATDYPFMDLCKEAYVVQKERKQEKVKREDYIKPLVFHDGRLAIRPTPMVSLAIFLWFPVGLVLGISRMLVGLCLPYTIAFQVGSFLGVRIRVRGSPPLPSEASKGTLFVCTHRTLLDPVFLSIALRRPVAAVTYSVSRFSELTSPIQTVRLTRNRDTDGRTMRDMLEKGDLAVCPEGTTCREPYLLRFSPLFAEVSEDIVPVAMNAKPGMFHGNTARGLKCFDPLFFLMNPFPRYDVHFMERLPREIKEKKSVDVANHVQSLLAKELGFECTNLRRKDKYMVLANNDGTVPQIVTQS